MERLKKILMKDYKNTEDAGVRNRYGVTAGVLGLISNGVLFVCKLVIGILGGSVTMIGDAVNNLSDSGSSIITVVGFKLSARPADKEHPYGHARYEYIASMAVAALIIIMGAFLAASSVNKLRDPKEMSVSAFAYVVIALSFVLKLFQFLLYRDFGKSIRSSTLKAASWDSILDILVTAMTLLVTVIYDITDGVDFDGMFGVIVAGVIVVSGLRLLKETVTPLIGGKPDKESLQKVEEHILSYEGVLGVHDIVMHHYGETTKYATADVEVPVELCLGSCHRLADEIERDALEKLGVKLTVHIDPHSLSDARTNDLRVKTEAAVIALDGSFSIHDFQTEDTAEGIKILFDVSVPFDKEMTEETLHNAVRTALMGEEHVAQIVLRIDRF